MPLWAKNIGQDNKKGTLHKIRRHEGQLVHREPTFSFPFPFFGLVMYVNATKDCITKRGTLHIN